MEQIHGGRDFGPGKCLEEFSIKCWIWFEKYNLKFDQNCNLTRDLDLKGNFREKYSFTV